MQEAVDKITKPYYRILAGQNDAPATVGKAVEGATPSNGRGFIEYLPTNDGAASGSATGGAAASNDNTADGNAAAAVPIISADDDPPLLDLEELAAWTFEDWAFTPGDFSSLGEGL